MGGRVIAIETTAVVAPSPFVLNPTSDGSVLANGKPIGQFSVTGSGTWTATADAGVFVSVVGSSSSCSGVVPTTGSASDTGNGIVCYQVYLPNTVAANGAAAVRRTLMITVASQAASVQFPITQEALGLSPSSLTTFSATSAPAQSVTLRNTTAYFTKAADSWVTVTQSGMQVTVSVTQNNGSSSRTLVVDIFADSMLSSVQDQNDDNRKNRDDRDHDEELDQSEGGARVHG